MSAPAPGLDLHLKVRGAFVAQGTSFKRWCRDNGIKPTNARDALIGRWNGPKGQAMRARIVESAGLLQVAA